MKQPVKGKGKVKRKKPRVYVKKRGPFARHSPTNQEYGTSQLERDFASDFLDKYGIRYIYQFEAKDIKRYFDFAITVYDDTNFFMEEKDGIECIRQENQFVPIDLLIEVDGSYYHSDPRLVKEDKLNPMQKHNKFVDGLKDKWAQMHCVPLLRIWEYDIRNNPKAVVEEMSKYLDMAKKRMTKRENKKKPH